MSKKDNIYDMAPIVVPDETETVEQVLDQIPETLAALMGLDDPEIITRLDAIVDADRLRSWLPDCDGTLHEQVVQRLRVIEKDRANEVLPVARIESRSLDTMIEGIDALEILRELQAAESMAISHYETAMKAMKRAKQEAEFATTAIARAIREGVCLRQVECRVELQADGFLHIIRLDTLEELDSEVPDLVDRMGSNEDGTF